MFRVQQGLRRQKILLVVLGVLVFIMMITWFKGDDIIWDFSAPNEATKVLRSKDLKHEKWIIVTTIQLPTPALKKLVQIPDWKLLVVADRKTPKTWSLPGAIFLDMKSQKDLRYQVNTYLPYDSYTRKVIGYLYAIEHGAKYIYETDDDNTPEGNLDQFQTSVGRSDMLLLQTNNATYNPLVHFGQGTMWPRGFPLDQISLPSPREYILCEMHMPSIQQGLVNGDPDVDAIFRMTRKSGTEELNVNFDSVAPPVVLPQGTFAPFNTQNTFFSTKAFWGLVLPVSVTMRACDIYRSYWAQTLLWLLGENIVFQAPDIVQKRNPHSYLADAYEETAIYHNMGSYVHFLKQWKCRKVLFFGCVSQLTHDLVAHGFLGKIDADVVDAWLSDLVTMGYTPPVMPTDPKNCQSKDALSVIFYPDEQPTVLPHSTQRLLPTDLVNLELVTEYRTKICGRPSASHWQSTMHQGLKFDREILVISIQVDPEDVIPALESTYRPHFPHILYCGAKPKDEAFLRRWRVSYVTPSQQVTGVSCVLTAIRMRYHANAFIHITDTMYLNMHGNKLLSSRQKHLTWVTGDLNNAHLCKGGSINCIQMSKTIIGQVNGFTSQIQLDGAFKAKIQLCFDKLRANPSFQTSPTLTWVTDMTFSVPASARDKFQALAELYNNDSQKMKYDFFSLLVLSCLEHGVEYMSYGDVSEPENNSDYLFPYSFKQVEVDKGMFNQHFCDHFEKYSSNEQS